MTRVLAVADEIDRSLTVARIKELRPSLVVSCGDLPYDYLEFLVTVANAPLLFVPGNHDPDLRRDPAPNIHLPQFDHVYAKPPGPGGCNNIDGRVQDAAGLRVAGLGGSIRYRPGPNQYSEREMRRRSRRLVRRWRRRAWRDRRRVNLLITHSPPAGLGDAPDDAHRGFASFRELVQTLQPAMMLHGHIHPHGFDKPDRELGTTRLINVIPFRLLQIDP